MFETIGSERLGPPEPTPRGWGHILVGATLLLVGLPAGLWLNGRAETQEFGVYLTLFSAGFGVSQISKGRRLVTPNAEGVRRRDRRAPILFLRPFPLRRAEPLQRTYEQRLARAVRTLGPFIAIGAPTDPLPELGAARLYVPDTEWQKMVLRLLDECQLVIFHCGSSDGVLWELAQVIAGVDPQKVVLSLPFKERGQRSLDVVAYNDFRDASASLFVHPLPIPSARARFLVFDRDWRPVLLRTVAETDNDAHQRLLRAFSDRLPTGWIPAPATIAGWGLLALLLTKAPQWGWRIGEQTGWFGFGKSERDVAADYAAALTARQNALNAIPERLPKPGTVQLLILPDTLTPPPSCRDERTCNTEFLWLEQIRLGHRSALGRGKVMAPALQLIEGARPVYARDPFRATLESAARIRYVLVSDIISYRRPRVCSVEPVPVGYHVGIDRGSITVDGFLVDLSDNDRVVAMYEHTAKTDFVESDYFIEHIPALVARLQQSADRTLTDQIQARVLAAVARATRGLLQPDAASMQLPLRLAYLTYNLNTNVAADRCEGNGPDR